MPFINVRLVKEVIAADPEGSKARIADAIATVVADTTGLAKSEVWIVFEEVEARNWYLGEDSVKRLRFDK